MWKLAIVAACGIACGSSFASAQSVSPNSGQASASMQDIVRGVSEGASAVAPGLDSVSALSATEELSAVAPAAGSVGALAATEDLSAVQKGLANCDCVRGLLNSANRDAVAAEGTRSLLSGATDDNKSPETFRSSLAAGVESDLKAQVTSVNALAGEAASAPEASAANRDVN
jgi:hypothetical protein